MDIIIEIFVELVDIDITLYCIESHNDILIKSNFQTHAIMLTCDIFTTQLLGLAWWVSVTQIGLIMGNLACWAGDVNLKRNRHGATGMIFLNFPLRRSSKQKNLK